MHDFTQLTSSLAQVQQADGWELVCTRGVKLSKISTDQGDMECPLPFLDKVWAEQQFEWGSGSWALAHNAMRSTVLDAVHECLSSDLYLDMVMFMFHEALQAEHPLKLRLQRFSSLNQLLHTELLPAVVSQALAACKPALTDMVNSLFNQHCYGTMPSDAFTELDGRIRGYITQQIQAHLAHLANPGMVPPSFTLTEDDSTAAARAALLDKLKKLQAATHTINRIAGVPEAGSYAHVISTGTPKQPAESDNTTLEIGNPPFSGSGQFSWRWPAVCAKQDTDSSKQSETTINPATLKPATEAAKELSEAVSSPSSIDWNAWQVQNYAYASRRDKKKIRKAQRALLYSSISDD